MMRIIVNSEELDLFVGAEYKFERNLKNYSEPATRFMDSMYETSLPKTANNLRILNIIDEKGAINRFDEFLNETNIIEDSIVILTGYLRVTSITQDEIEIEAYSKFLELADGLQGKQLRDLIVPKSEFDYENTVRDHINHRYTYDSVIRPIPPLSSAELLAGGFTKRWLLGRNPEIVSLSNSTSQRLKYRYKTKTATNYVIRIVLSDITSTGTSTLRMAYYNDTNLLVQTSVTIVKDANNMFTTNLSLTANADGNYLMIWVSTTGNLSCTLLSAEQITPTPNTEVLYQWVFGMWERHYTIKPVIDSRWRGNTYVSNPPDDWNGDHYQPGSTTSQGQDPQRKQFEILNEIYSRTDRGDLQYPMSNYTNYWQFLPAFYLGKIVKMICNQAGWQVAGSLLQDPEFKKAFMVYSGSGELWKTLVISSYNKEEAVNDLFKATRVGNSVNSSMQQTGVYKNGKWTVDASQVIWQQVPFNFANEDVNANYNTSTGVYTFSTAYKAQFFAMINAAWTLSTDTPLDQPAGPATANWRIWSNIKGTIATVTKTRTHPIISSYTGTFLLSTPVLEFEAGEQIRIQAAAYGSQYAAGSLSTRVDSNFYNFIYGGVGKEIPILNPVAALSKMSQLDFLKNSIVGLFNAYYTVDVPNRTLYLETYKNLMQSNNMAIDLSDKVKDDEYSIEIIPAEERNIRFLYDENSDDDVAFMPNNLTYPVDYSKMVSFRNKEIKIGDKIYTNNEIFNMSENPEGAVEFKSNLAPTNFRQYWLYNMKQFDNSMFDSFAPSPIFLPTLTSVEKLQKDWFSETDGVDTKPGPTDWSYGSGNRVLKYDGYGQYNYANVAYDTYWLYLGDPGYYSTAGDDNIRYKVEIGLTSFLSGSATMVDDELNEYFNTSKWSLVDTPMNLSFANFYKYSNPDDPTQISYGWQTYVNGTFSQLRDDMYTIYFEEEYAALQGSELLTVDLRITKKDWNDCQVWVPIIVYGVTYTIKSIDAYSSTEDIARFKIIKR